MPSALIESAIETVAVYRTGALVTRVAEITRVAEGGFPAKVRINNLPLTLEDASVSVRIEGGASGGRVPLASDVEIGLSVGEPDAALAPPRDEALEAARREEVGLERRRQVVAREQALISSLEAPSRATPKEGEPPRESPTMARLAILRFRKERSVELAARQHALQVDLDAARVRRHKLEEQARLASTAREARPDELRKSATVTLCDDGVETDKARLILQYLVPGARWVPAYSLRLGPALQSAELSVRALVRQRTGEDWSGVGLTLSTAAAQRWSELPELKAVRIGREQPRPRSRWRPPPTGVDDLYRDYDAAQARAAPPEPEPSDVFDDLVTGDLPTNMMELTASGAAPVVMEDLAEAEEQILDADDAMFGSAMPSPVAGGAPMPPPAPPPMAAAPAMPPPGMPPPEFSRSRSVSKRKKGARRSAPKPKPMPRIPEADDALLLYGNLRMRSASEPRRGHLVAEDQRTRYLQLILRQRVAVSFDVMHTIELAVAAAQRADDDPAPARHHFVSSEAGFDYAYPADSQVEIPSDGEFHTVPLQSREGDCVPKYVVVPRETQDVFRVVDLMNPLDAPLLAGPIDVYVGGDYLMTSEVSVTPARGQLRLGLGVEQAIKVSRNTRFEEQTAGLMRGSLDLGHEITIELVNHLPRTAMVEVRERVPTTNDNDDDVKVTVEDATPAWAPYKQKERTLDGGYMWTVAVLPQETETLVAKYTVRISSGDELVGGNRRES